MALTYPVYRISTQVSGYSAPKDRVSDFAKFVDLSAAILPGIKTFRLDDGGIRAVIQCEAEAQGVQLDLTAERASALFMHTNTADRATLMEIHALAFLFAALKRMRCCKSATMVAERPSAASVVSVAEDFAVRAVMDAERFGEACSDPRAACIVSIFEKLSEQGATPSDVQSLLETFCIPLSCAAEDVFTEAPRALLSSQLSLDQLHRIRSLYCTLA